MIGKNKKHGKVLVVAMAVILVVLLIRHFHIKNFHVIKPGVLYTSGQPRNMDYARILYKYHVATFINVRMPSEHREKNWYNEERTWIAENGVDYHELPIDRTDRQRQFPDEETQKKFLDIMADKDNLPVLLHGSSGRKRVSMLTAVWLIKSQKYSVSDTIKIVETIKEKPVTELEKQFIEDLTE